MFKKTGSCSDSWHQPSLTVALIKYSTASMDFVFPKKWRSPRLMDPGEVGVTLEPAQEHAEEGSKQPSESATDQSPKMVASTAWGAE